MSTWSTRIFVIAVLLVGGGIFDLTGTLAYDLATVMRPPGIAGAIGLGMIGIGLFGLMIGFAVELLSGRKQ